MTLDPEQRIAGIAAGALLFTLFLPWYQKSVVVDGELVEDNLSAFGVFTFVEAAILLVALGVFALLWARSQRKPFHLPGGDGTVIFAAGVWAALLLLWRVFDRPDVEGAAANVGIAWGFFFAFLAAGALAAAGWRIRAAHRPEPPNPIAVPRPEDLAPRRRRPLREDTAMTREVAPEGPPEFDLPARRRPRPDEEATRAMPREDEEPTRALPREGEEPTRALPREPDHPSLFDDPAREAPPDRLFDDEEPTRRSP